MHSLHDALGFSNKIATRVVHDKSTVSPKIEFSHL